jgi:hypothetical protein
MRLTYDWGKGLFFILCVSIIWAASSVLVQHVYDDLEFRAPLFVTYVASSLFMVFLPLWWVKQRRQDDHASSPPPPAGGSGNQSYTVVSTLDAEDTGLLHGSEEDGVYLAIYLLVPPSLSIRAAVVPMTASC